MPAVVVPSPPVPADPYVFDIARYGARTGTTDAAMAATSAAIDRILALNLPTGVRRTIKVPSSTDAYYVARSHFLSKGYVTVRGDNRDNSRLLMCPHRSDPVFYVGVPLAPGGVALTSDHAYNITSRLDGTAGTRYALRTRANSHLAQMFGPFAYGRPPTSGDHQYWADADCITVDLLLDTTDVAMDDGPVCAIYDNLIVQIDPDRVTCRLWLWTRDTYDGPATLNQFSLNVGAGSGLKRIVLQANMLTRTVVGGLAGNQVAVTGSWAAPAPPPGGRTYMGPVEAVPFLIGSYALGTVTIGWGDNRDRDFAIGGLHLSAAPVYANDGVGQPLRRLDASPVNDSTRYFTRTDATVALLPLTQPPSAMPGRQVEVMASARSQAGNSCLLFFSPEHGNESNSAVSDIRFEDITVSGYLAGGGITQTYGQGVALGLPLDSTFERCRIEGGAVGIGSINYLASYKTRIKDIIPGGNDAGIYFYYSIADIENVFFPTLGRNCLWGRLSTIDIRDVRTNQAGPCDRVFYCVDGSMTADRINVDIEDGAHPKRCLAEIQTVGNLSGLGSFEFSNIQVGGFLNGIDYFILGGLPNQGTVRFNLRGLWGDTRFKRSIAYVNLPGAMGTVDIDAQATGAGATPVIVTGPNGSGHKVTRVGPSAP
jgi:hypothetical protein